MKRLFLLLLLPAIVSLLMAKPAVSQEVSIGNRRTFPWVSHESKTYFGMQTGLFAYDYHSDVWNATYVGEDAASNRINVLGMDEDILWVGTNGGVANSDIRLGDWITYDVEGGLPSDTVLSLAFEEDYAWVGTPNGAARFDKLTEEWDVYDSANGLSSDRVNDIIVRTDRVWFCTDRGVSEYDTEYEVWRIHVDETSALAGVIERVYAWKGFLWFFGKKGVTRYDEDTRSWSEYSQDAWKPSGVPDQILSQGDSLWLIVDGGVYVFDSRVDAVSEFEYSSGLGERKARFMSAGWDQIWMATDKDIARFDKYHKTWKFYGAAQGLQSQDFLTIVGQGSPVFAFARDGSIYYQLTRDGRWYEREPLKSIEEEISTKLRLTSDERGTGLVLPYDNSLLLKGTTTWNRERVRGEWFDPDVRSDLNLYGTITGGRTLLGKYDNTRRDRTFYGMTYRGAQRDLLQEVSFGYDRNEFGWNRLVRSLDVSGTSAELGYGERSGRAKIVSFSATSGERRGGFDTDFFVGRRKEDSVTVRDIDYVQNRYFLLDIIDYGAPVVEAGTERLYRDDGSDETNIPSTILDTTIAGVTGDYDLLSPVNDYQLANENGVVKFKHPLGPGSVLGASFNSPDGRKDRIIRSDSVTAYELPNRYELSHGMVPMSLTLSITDTLGAVHDLSEFGLDRDMDGKIDPEYVDFLRGILFFPDRKPFPEEVYEAGTHIYDISARYNTTSPTYRLSHYGIVRLSETITVDGAPLERGNDYVLDYTTGRLVILKEELIGDRSHIDVTYEYEKVSDEQFNMVELKVNPNSAVTAVFRGIRFGDEEMGFEGSDLIQSSLEIRTRALGLDLRVPIELAKSLNDTLDGMAQRYSIYASRRNLGLNASYEFYEYDFVSFSPEIGRLGGVREAYALGAEYYFVDWLVGEVDWRHQSFLSETNSIEPSLENGRAEIVFNKPKLPAFSLFVSTDKSASDSTREKTRHVGSDVSYSVTREDLAALPVKSLNINSTLMRTWWEKPAGDISTKFDGGSFELLSTLFQGVSVGAEYLHRLALQDSAEGDGAYQTSSAGELQLNTNIDRIPGLALYLKTEREVEERPYGDRSGARDGTIGWRDYSRLAMFPGMWFSRFSFIDFEYEFSRTLSAHIKGASKELSLDEKYWHLPGTLLNWEGDTKTDNFTSRVRPNANLVFDLGYERKRIRERHDDSENERRYDAYDARAEFTPRYRSIITMTYHQSEDEYLGRNIFSPAVWWEERWAHWIFAKVGFSYGFTEDSISGFARTKSRLTPQMSVTLRARDLPVLGYVELGTDLSLTRTTGSDITEEVKYSGSFQLDIRPIHLLRLKTKLDLGYANELSTNLLITLIGTF